MLIIEYAGHEYGELEYAALMSSVTVYSFVVQ